MNERVNFLYTQIPRADEMIEAVVARRGGGCISPESMSMVIARCIAMLVTASAGCESEDHRVRAVSDYMGKHAAGVLGALGLSDDEIEPIAVACYSGMRDAALRAQSAGRQ